MHAGLPLLYLLLTFSVTPAEQARQILDDPIYQQQAPPLPAPPSVRPSGDESPQTSLPAEAGQAEQPPPATRAQPDLVPTPPPEDEPRPPSVVPRLLGRLLLWLVLALVVIGVALWLLREVRLLRQRPRRLLRRPRTKAPEPPPEPLARLGQADELAADGCYGEAVHLLLQHALRRLAAGRLLQLQSHTTSREALAALAGSAELRPQLAALVEAVELFLFGGRPLTAVDYRRCQDAFDQLSSRWTP